MQHSHLCLDQCVAIQLLIPFHIHLTEIVRMVKQTLEETPPELSADIFDHGIVMTGGTALLPGLDQLLRAGTGVRVAVAKQPGSCTCLGMGVMLKSANGDFSKFVK